MLLIHICGATIALISGFLATFVRKGSGWHAVAGNVFSGSMLAMATSAVYLSIFVKPIMINVIAGMLTIYLVSTGWWTAKRRAARTGTFDVVALLFVVMISSAGWMFGLQAAQSPTGMKDKMPAAGYFIFGTVALLFALLDVGMIVRGGVAGPRRLARHLWRMGLALLLATASLFPGQLKLFPMWRKTALPYVPHVLLIGSLLFWTARLLRRKRAVVQTPASVPLAARYTLDR